METSNQQKQFFRADDLAARYGCTKRSIYRWMKLAEKPFPAPRINREGITPLWAVADVVGWEEGEGAATVTD